MPTELRYDEREHVGIVTLDRPHARNALTFTTYAELEDVVRSTTARCLVITGADPAFCSGDDVKQIMANAGGAVADGLRNDPKITPAAAALLETDVPIIATVNGAAVGWGMELAAALALADEIATNSPLAVQRIKQGLRRALDPDWDELGAWVTGSLADLFRTADHREGAAAFMEKREPRFEGR